MLQSLAVAAVVVVVLWVVILGLYLVVARRQPDVAAQMKALDEQLNRAERESGHK
jgi:predicted Holliday junction resolvase-like endonuclease